MLSIATHAAVLTSCGLAQVTFDQVEKIMAPGTISGDGFGGAVSIWGDRAIVGASMAGVGGRAYTFVRQGQSWLFEDELVRGDPEADDFYGTEVSVYGDTAIVGSPRDDDDGSFSGTAYVFVRTDGAWSQQAKLTASDAETLDFFGTSVSISGDSILVSATGDDDMGSNAGAAYVFVRNGFTWSQEAKLTAPDGGSGDQFGSDVSVSGDTVVIGSPHNFRGAVNAGAAYVYHRSGTTWSLQQKLIPSDFEPTEEFGLRVAIDGDLVVASAVRDDDGGTNSGSAYVFVRSGRTWSEEAKLTALDAATESQFGSSLSISGGRILVGSQAESTIESIAGAAYLFTKQGASWVQEAKFAASDAAAFDFLGTSVALGAESLLVGAPRDDDVGTDSGSLYVFTLNNRSCFGMSCPCGNNDELGGCRNSSGTGSKLRGLLSTSIAANVLTLSLTDAPAGNLGLFFVADSDLAMPVQVGDGLACLGGNSFRYGPSTVSANGAMSLTSVVSSAPPGFYLPGELRFFQAWTRDVYCTPAPVPCPSPCGGGSNLSNAVEVLFYP